MDRLIWQPGCSDCERVRDRLVRRRNLTLVAGLFPPTPHARHGFTVIRPSGTGVTGLAAERQVRQWTGPSTSTALAVSATVIGLWLLSCAGLAFWPP